MAELAPFQDSGAEAVVASIGPDVVRKTRLPKPYRHPQLDQRLRQERTREEALCLIHARKLGVRVPVLLDADLANQRLDLERIHGPRLRDVIETQDPEVGRANLRQLGAWLQRLHAGRMVHGDLTTSNVLLDDHGLCLIDFGLGSRNPELEDYAVDLHVLHECLLASHQDHTALWEAFLDGYAPSREVAARYEEVLARGRYRGAG